MMEDNKQLALRIDGAVQSASQEVTNLRAELTATNRRLAELSGGGGPGPGPGAAASASAADSAAANMENHQHGAQGRVRSAPRAEARRGEASKRAGPAPEVAGDSVSLMPGATSPCLVAGHPFRPEVATAAPLLGVAGCCHSRKPGRALWARVHTVIPAPGCVSEAQPAGPFRQQKVPFRWHTAPSSVGKLFMPGPWPPPPAGANATAPPSSGGVGGGLLPLP